MAEAKKKSRKGKSGISHHAFSNYLYKVLKQVHPDAGLPKPTMEMLDLMCTDIIKRVSNRSNSLLQVTRRRTVTSREIQSAIRLVLPGELAKHAVSEGTKAVTKFNATPAGGAVKAATGKKETHRREYRAGLQFSISRVEKAFMRNSTADRKGAGMGIYLAAVVEYLMAEILELSGNAARDNKVKKIKPRHIMLAIRNDEELNHIWKDTILAGGVMPNIYGALLPSKKETSE